MQLKHIHLSAVPRALALAERYRLLNEPEQAESICKDVLDVDPDNQLAIRTLLLSITDQFGRKQSARVQHAEDVVARLTSEYERHYYNGVVMERWARAKLQESKSMNLVHDWLHRAMEEYERAELIRPSDDESSVLRWNTCARLIKSLPKREEPTHSADYGD